ncbi:MAG TPA: translation elongation factor Ts [Candidatus Baltobacteraceae bacterium]|nr:translation elongation factor Ts [Candidatus Baltobacteraceae bacterium]
MTISATMVRDLREKTGAGIMECKAALAESGGDLDKAIDVLRKRGLKVAEKKAGRVAADGLVVAWTSADHRAGALVEINCETDFVARTDKFVALAQSLGPMVGSEPAAAEIAVLLTRELQGKPVADVVKELIGAIGENIVVRRAAHLAVRSGAKGLVASYLHAGGKIGVLVAVQCGSDKVAQSDELGKLAKDLALQVCSAEPGYVSRDQVPADVLDKERDILRAQPDLQGKPAAIQDKIIQGRLEKFYAERCLVDQLFIRDPDGKQKVKDVLAAAQKSLGEPISVTGFARFRLGEGVEKRAAE